MADWNLHGGHLDRHHGCQRSVHVTRRGLAGRNGPELDLREEEPRLLRRTTRGRQNIFSCAACLTITLYHRPNLRCTLCCYSPANMLRSPCRSIVSPPLKSSLVAVFISCRSTLRPVPRGGVGRNKRAQVMIETASGACHSVGCHRMPASKMAAPTMNLYAHMKTCSLY